MQPDKVIVRGGRVIPSGTDFKEETATYVVRILDHGLTSLMHKTCGQTTYNPNDVANRYCPKCGLWLE